MFWWKNKTKTHNSKRAAESKQKLFLTSDDLKPEFGTNRAEQTLISSWKQKQLLWIYLNREVRVPPTPTTTTTWPHPSKIKNTARRWTQKHTVCRRRNEIHFLFLFFFEVKVKDMQEETKANRGMKDYMQHATCSLKPCMRIKHSYTGYTEHNGNKTLHFNICVI